MVFERLWEGLVGVRELLGGLVNLWELYKGLVGVEVL